MKSSTLLTAVCAFTLALLKPVPSGANEFGRLKSLEALQSLSASLRTQDYVFVPGSHVAFANYKRIREDWAITRQMTDAEIDAFLLARFSYVSRLQLKLRTIRTNDFFVDETKIQIGRQPPGWNRAAIEGETELADVKGSGHGSELNVARQLFDYRDALTLPPEQRSESLNKLRTRDHSDGLMTLGEAIAETTRQMAVQRLFNRENAIHQTSLQTVETYFVIALPIEILKLNGATETAALYGRQAHIGRSANLEVPPRLYIDPHGGVQRTWFNSAVDFGGVRITAPDFLETFGSPAIDPQSANAWKYGHETADAFVKHIRNGETAEARLAVEHHIADMLKPVPDTPETVDAEIRFFKDRMDLPAAGVYSVRELLRKSIPMDTILKSASPTAYLNYFKALIYLRRESAEVEAFIPRLVSKLGQAHPVEAGELLQVGLKAPAPYWTSLLHQAAEQLDRKTFAESFNRDRGSDKIRDEVLRELAAMAVSSASVSTSSSPSSPSPSSAAALSKAQASALAALRETGQDVTRLALECKDIFAQTSKKKGRK